MDRNESTFYYIQLIFQSQLLSAIVIYYFLCRHAISETHYLVFYIRPRFFVSSTTTSFLQLFESLFCFPFSHFSRSLLCDSPPFPSSTAFIWNMMQLSQIRSKLPKNSPIHFSSSLKIHLWIFSFNNY